MPNTTPETMDFLKAAHNGPPVYHALCLRLAREARGVASLYPSALAAQQATPQQRRVSWADVRKGHIAYFDDPSDGNSFGHVATCAGRTGDGRRLWWTNDAKRSGGVDLVADPSTDTSWFGAHWGDRFVFGTDWVNGVRFHIGADGDGGGPPEPPPDPPEVNELVRIAVRGLRKAATNAENANRPKRAAALQKDIERLRKRYNLDA